MPAGLPATSLAPLQRVLHARLVNGLRTGDNVLSALKELHWMPIVQRIESKLCLLVHKSFVVNAPVYLKTLLTAVANVPLRSALRDAEKGQCRPPSVSANFSGFIVF